jgi:hypothetical protein
MALRLCYDGQKRRLVCSLSIPLNGSCLSLGNMFGFAASVYMKSSLIGGDSGGSILLTHLS